jgi:hypothetical protein
MAVGAVVQAALSKTVAAALGVMRVTAARVVLGTQLRIRALVVLPVLAAAAAVGAAVQTQLAALAAAV